MNQLESWNIVALVLSRSFAVAAPQNDQSICSRPAARSELHKRCGLRGK